MIQNIDILNALVEGGVEAIKKVSERLFDFVDQHNNSSMHIAVANGIRQFKLVLEMVVSNIGINKKNIAGKTVLHIAIIKNASLDHIELIIKHGIDVNSQDKHGRTALHLAAKKARGKSLLIVISLMKYGCSVMVRDNCNRLPLDYLHDSQIKEIVLHGFRDCCITELLYYAIKKSYCFQ